jgi:RNA polymerase sigma factor (TIGR02999 family)
MIYDGLVGLARNRLARYGTREYLNPAELVHEAYLRVVESKQASFEGCRHLFFVISRAMGDLLIEGIRRNATEKRGGGLLHVELEAVEITIEPHSREYLDLERALRRLAYDSPVSARVVMLSYFAGFTYPEIAGALRISRATVERHGKHARTWLRHELSVRGVRGFGAETRLND